MEFISGSEYDLSVKTSHFCLAEQHVSTFDFFELGFHVPSCSMACQLEAAG
jgi:hypothetical protein